MQSINRCPLIWFFYQSKKRFPIHQSIDRLIAICLLSLFHCLSQSLAHAWHHVADFKLVYISEAHATDEWPIGSARFNGDRGVVAICQPKSTRERCEVAVR